MKRLLPHLIILAMAGSAAFTGLLSQLVFQLADLGFRLAPLPASGDIVIVGIDRRSLDRLGPWPWPRRHHAIVLDRLKAAGAGRIALDLDMSGRTNAVDDQALADAIGRSNGRIILPVFRPSPRRQKVPYAPFTLDARLGTANIKLAADQSARRYLSGDDWNGSTVSSLAGLLAGNRTPGSGSFFVDYGIDPASVPRLSYADILAGTFPTDAIRGKTIIIGAMAPELGDRLRVPVHGVLSGPLIHALAAESLVQGRDIYVLAALFMMLVAFLLCYSAGWVAGQAAPRLAGFGRA